MTSPWPRTRRPSGFTTKYALVSRPDGAGRGSSHVLSEKGRLADEVARLYSAFEEALYGDKRKYPLQEFKAFWEAGRRYAELTKSDTYNPTSRPRGQLPGGRPSTRSGGWLAQARLSHH